MWSRSIFVVFIRNEFSIRNAPSREKSEGSGHRNGGSGVSCEIISSVSFLSSPCLPSLTHNIIVYQLYGTYTRPWTASLESRTPFSTSNGLSLYLLSTCLISLSLNVRSSLSYAKSDYSWLALSLSSSFSLKHSPTCQPPRSLSLSLLHDRRKGQSQSISCCTKRWREAWSSGIHREMLGRRVSLSSEATLLGCRARKRADIDNFTMIQRGRKGLDRIWQLFHRRNWFHQVRNFHFRGFASYWFLQTDLIPLL